MIYIGIDLHARNFSMAVLDQYNSIIFEQTLPTSCQNLQAAVSAFAEGESVVFEESTLAAWAYRVLQPCPDRVVVADPLHNHWIAGDEKSKAREAARKRYTAEEKIRMVMEGIRGEEAISAICRREGIPTNMYYRWLRSFREVGYPATVGSGSNSLRQQNEVAGVLELIVGRSRPLPGDPRLSEALVHPDIKPQLL